MKETQELALAVKSVTNTGFIQLKPLHSLIRKEWLAWVYFRRLPSVSARTAVCSELVSGVIPLSPSPSCQSPGLDLTRSPAKCQVTFWPAGLSRGHVTDLGFAHKSTARSSMQAKERALQFLIDSSPHLLEATKRCLLQAVWPVRLGRCWRKHLPKALPCSHPRTEHTWSALGQPAHPSCEPRAARGAAAALPPKPALKEGVSPSTRGHTKGSAIHFTVTHHLRARPSLD